MENEIVVIMSLGSNFQKAIFKIPGMEILYKKHLFFFQTKIHIFKQKLQYLQMKIKDIPVFKKI